MSYVLLGGHLACSRLGARLWTGRNDAGDYCPSAQVALLRIWCSVMLLVHVTYDACMQSSNEYKVIYSESRKDTSKRQETGDNRPPNHPISFVHAWQRIYIYFTATCIYTKSPAPPPPPPQRPAKPGQALSATMALDIHTSLA